MRPPPPPAGGGRGPHDGLPLEHVVRVVAMPIIAQYATAQRRRAAPVVTTGGDDGWGKQAGRRARAGQQDAQKNTFQLAPSRRSLAPFLPAEA